MTRLHIVTGKGGTGKTSVAAALAWALASRPGRRVLVCEVEQRQGLARVFDTGPLPYSETRVARIPGGGEIHGLAVDAEAALMEYLALFYHLGRAGRVLKQLGAVDFATTIAPGLRDVLLTGKVYEAARRRTGGRGSGSNDFVYDAVVLDAPPTGRIGRFLNVNAEVAGLARVGPIHRQADSIMSLLRSERTAVHLVTLLEEMPVQETVEAARELRELGMPLGHVVLNMAAPDLPADVLTSDPSDPDAVSAVGRALRRSGLRSDGTSAGGGAGTATALLDEAAEEARRIRTGTSLVDALDATGLPRVELPLLPGGVDAYALEDLAVALAPLTEDGAR